MMIYQSSLTKDMIQDHQREQEEEDFYEDKGAAYEYRPYSFVYSLLASLYSFVCSLYRESFNKEHINKILLLMCSLLNDSAIQRS